MSASFKSNPIDFMHKFVTMDETRVHHSPSETKQQLKQSKELMETHGFAYSIVSAEKVIDSIFLDAEGYFN